DQVRFSFPLETNGFHSPELFIRSPSGRCLYQTLIGYAAKPKIDRQTHPYVQTEIRDGRLGFACLHIPCPVIRDYFYRPKRSNADECDSLYKILKVKPNAPPADIRLAYRLRHLELVANNAPKTAHLSLTRAMNILAVPELRACHDALLADPRASVVFPFA